MYNLTRMTGFATFSIRIHFTRLARPDTLPDLTVAVAFFSCSLSMADGARNQLRWVLVWNEAALESIVSFRNKPLPSNRTVGAVKTHSVWYRRRLACRRQRERDAGAVLAPRLSPAHMRIRESDREPNVWGWVLGFGGVVGKPVVYNKNVSERCAQAYPYTGRPTVTGFALHAIVVREDVRDAIPISRVPMGEHLDPWMRAEYGDDVYFLRELHDDLVALLVQRAYIERENPFRSGVSLTTRAFKDDIPCLPRTRTRARASYQA